MNQVNSCNIDDSTVNIGIIIIIIIVMYCMLYVLQLVTPSCLWQLDSTWILFNKAKSETLTNEHAGFLMGQGLNGHLAKLATLNVHDYLIKVCFFKVSLYYLVNCLHSRVFQ